MKMLLKISTGKLSSKHNFPGGSTFQALRAKAAEITGLAEYEIELLEGFPPRALYSADDEKTLESLGLQSGTAITVRPSAVRKDLYQALVGMGFPAATVIKTLTQMQIDASMTKLSNEQLETGIELCQALAFSVEAPTSSGSRTQGEVVRKSIPADNSCLFNSIGYLLHSSDDFNPMQYRYIVAQTIRSNPEYYNTEFLEKTPEDYVLWITNADKWGGEIEISILCQALRVQIAVVDIRSATILTYGEDLSVCAQRIVYLLYDGVHYDALVFRHTATVEGHEQRIFHPQHDDFMNSLTQRFAQVLQSRKQFVNIATGQLQCTLCYQVFAGQREATLHAKLTGHQSFGQT